jgi:hypothetical protein
MFWLVMAIFVAAILVAPVLAFVTGRRKPG